MNRLNQLAINRDGFAFDPETGESFSINGTGRHIIQALLVGRTETEIVETLVEEYEVDGTEAARDVGDFLDQLRIYRLL